MTPLYPASILAKFSTNAMVKKQAQTTLVIR